MAAVIHMFRKSPVAVVTRFSYSCFSCFSCFCGFRHENASSDLVSRFSGFARAFVWLWNAEVCLLKDVHYIHCFCNVSGERDLFRSVHPSVDSYVLPLNTADNSVWG